VWTFWRKEHLFLLPESEPRNRPAGSLITTLSYPSSHPVYVRILFHVRDGNPERCGFCYTELQWTCKIQLLHVLKTSTRAGCDRLLWPANTFTLSTWSRLLTPPVIIFAFYLQRTLYLKPGLGAWDLLQTALHWNWFSATWIFHGVENLDCNLSCYDTVLSCSTALHYSWDDRNVKHSFQLVIYSSVINTNNLLSSVLTL
jgi:hypothetical protein